MNDMELRANLINQLHRYTNKLAQTIYDEPRQSQETAMKPDADLLDLLKAATTALNTKPNFKLPNGTTSYQLLAKMDKAIRDAERAISVHLWFNRKRKG